MAIIIAGLGNPGASYVGHRHNVGFMLVEKIAALHGFSNFKTDKTSAVAEGRIANNKAIVIKPLSFMNASGLPIRKLLDFYKLGPEALTVLHDDIDLAAGKVRVKTGGGHGGHNGLRDIDKHLGNDYRRIRIGVGRPPFVSKKADAYVLSDFSKDDHEQWLDTLLDCMAKEIDCLYTGKDADFMTLIALKCPPPEQAKANNEE